MSYREAAWNIGTRPFRTAGRRLVQRARRARGSYSQYGEDLVLERLLGRRRSGFYVDVGASHPTELSNTQRFYERGWSGINIDALPAAVEAFRKERPRDINIACGVGPVAGTLLFYEIDPPTLSTFSQSDAGQQVRAGYRLVGTTKVLVRPLAEILDQHAPMEIAFLSVDAEGFDLEVLRSNDWTRHRPALVLVETNRDDSEILDYMALIGYRCVWANHTNSIFRSSSRA